MDASTNPRLKRYIDDEQWIESWRRNPKGRWWREPVFWLWGITSHCGRSIGLWIGWAFLLAVLFGVLYAQYPFPSWLSWIPGLESRLTNVPHPDLHIALTESNVVGEVLRETTWFTPYYFSIVTFTTLGFGDVTPLDLAGEIWLAIEVVLGYVMLGGLISIFANKFARRVSISMVIRMRYRANMGLIYGRLRQAGTSWRWNGTKPTWQKLGSTCILL